MIKRIFLIVLDSLGIGELPDAKLYGDENSNTLKALYESGKLEIPTLIKLGLGNIDGVNYLPAQKNLNSSVCRLAEKSMGKDTTVGHFELSGVIISKPFPTYPNGFPKEFIEEFENKIGSKTLCNMAYSGTEVIKDYGKEHMKTLFPIVYTSADSVLQIAVNEDVYGLENLYKICEIARTLACGDMGVARVIARPFKEENGKFIRTENRKDYSLEAPKKTMLDILKGSGLDVISVGKIANIFAGRGLTKEIPTHNNFEGMAESEKLLKTDFNGLAFINLVDFDMLYGHRNDVLGYTNALNDFDKWLQKQDLYQKDTIIMITADHGCDPSTASTDHSREYVPLILIGESLKNINYGTRKSFSDIGKTILHIFNLNGEIDGESLL